MNYPYLIIEKDVNGADEDAREYVQFKAELTPDQLETLKRCMEQAKTDALKDSDTYDMVQDGLRLFERETGLAGETRQRPFYGTIEF